MSHEGNGGGRPQTLDELRALLVAQRSAETLGPEEVEAAREMRRLRSELSASLGALYSCTECGRGHLLPEGRWDGGKFCSDPAAAFFDAETLAQLRAAGTEPADLVGPCDERAGCLMRGPEGCAIPREHRPNACVGYLCEALRRELEARGDLQEIQQKRYALAAAERRFAALRAARELSEAMAKAL